MLSISQQTLSNNPQLCACMCQSDSMTIPVIPNPGNPRV